ncbi:MAG: right-handed parallel beta-helix repeat-containing protein, partial [Nanoarchaeota archaeon]|nr:right-handed parallel beta-helix repeat-containing protein [Nanoarchaeota archaeon]
VEYNTFSNTAWEAIASYGASNAVITHNYISNSGQHAIQFMGHSGSDNEISYNHISGIVDKNAIQYWGGSGAIITHNMIVGEGTMYDGIWLDAAADESTVSNNQIFDTVYAGINVRGDCTDATVTYNNISGCGTGVDVVGSITGTVINFNAIHGNGMGVSNYYSTDIINAEFNWWGDDSGPTHSTNPSGIGDAVSDNVDFTPWWNVSNEEVVKIDIKPGSDTNSINLGSKGVVSVAVLTTNYFDVSTINEATVTFAGAPQVKVILEDRDGDGDLDMVFHFRTQDLGLDENSTEATLCGDYSYNEILTQSFRGTDTVNIVPTKTSAKKQKQNSMMNQDSESASYTTYHGNGIYSTTHLLRKDEIKPEKAPKKAVTQGPTLYKLMGVKWASTPDYVAQSDLLVIAATASITTWNNATEFGLLGVGSVNADIPFEAFDEDGKLITDGFNSYTYGNYPLSGVIAVCRTWWNAAGEIIEYDIMFDDDFAWGDATDDSTVMDLQNIATHEIGHAFGLLDLYNRPSVEQTMYGYSGYGETKKRDLEVGDIAGIQALYGNN